MTLTIKTTKEDVLRIYNECLEFLKNNYPKYYDVVKQYRFSFGKKKRSYGTCYYRTKEIKLHMYLIQTVNNTEAKDTILHEMAHAIDQGVNGYSSGHGYNWKRICKQIGCKPVSTSSVGADVIKPSKFVMVVTSDEGYEYVKPVHRLGSRTPLNKLLIGTYLRGRVKETQNKLMVVTFADFQANQKASDKD